MSELSLKLSKYDFATAKLVGEIQDGLIENDPVLGQIQKHSVAHDGNTRQVSSPKILDTPMQDYSVDLSIDIDLYRMTDAERFSDFIWNLLESLSSEMKKRLFEVVSQTTEITGNVVDGKGRNFWDSYIEMLENVEMTFDKDGNHNYAIYVHPETAKKLKDTPPTPEQIIKIENTIEAKRNMYYGRKRLRRLSQ